MTPRAASPLRSPIWVLCAVLSAQASAAGTGDSESRTGPEAPFVDATDRLGLDFHHRVGDQGRRHFPEIIGAGCAVLDYDGDGDLDLYLVQSGSLDPAAPAATKTDRLWRQDRAPNGAPLFVDVTQKSGLEASGYGVGVAVADIDDDGALDLYVANFGANQLWHNKGDGTFENWTERSGTAGADWSSSASFFDYDGDGRLDLYVVNFLEYDLDDAPACTNMMGKSEYCGPVPFTKVADRLYHNLGDGRFEDVSAAAGITGSLGAGLSAAALDVDGDGDPDLIVANDHQENFLWANQGNGRFVDEGLWRGVALNENGAPEASMGIAPADLDNDGDLDIFLTHIRGETNTLYVASEGNYEDRTRFSSLAPPSRLVTGFGVAWLDWDEDGFLDLLVANGDVRALEPLARAMVHRPFHQPDQLFRNLGNGRFEEATARAGEALALPETGRGMAMGDLDGDGDDDVLLSNNDGRARLLLDSGAPTYGVGVRLPNLEAAAGTVVVRRQLGPRSQWRWPRRDGSFASAIDSRVRFTVPPSSAPSPSGTVAEARETLVDRLEVATPGTRPGRLYLEHPPEGRELILFWPP